MPMSSRTFEQPWQSMVLGNSNMLERGIEAEQIDH